LSPHPDSPIVPESQSFVEQRLFLRKKVETPLPIELLPGKEVWLYDLGEGGLSVSGSSRVEPGTATFFGFEFPDPNSVIEAAGVVAWCDGSGRVGVRFTRIKPDSTAALKRWLKSEQSSPPDQKAEHTAVPTLSALVSRAHFEISDLRNGLASKELSGEVALKQVVERMAYHTRATGAAIALRQGSDVICRASTGNAPGIGVRLNIDSGLSGECYRTGNIVSLADSDHDSRVDAELCRQLDFRSLLIVPVVSAADIVVGVAEVFSSTPGNFEGGDVLLLSSIAELIGHLYDKNHRTISSVLDPQVCSSGMEQTESIDHRESAVEETAVSREIETSLAPFLPTGFEIADRTLRQEFIDKVSDQDQDLSGRTEDPIGQDWSDDQSPPSSRWKARSFVIGMLLLGSSLGGKYYVNRRFVHRHSAAPSQSMPASQSAEVPAASVPLLESKEQVFSPTASEPSANLQLGASVPNRTVANNRAAHTDSVESNFTRGLAGHLPRSEPAPEAPSLLASDRPAFRVDTTYFLPTKSPQVKLLNASLPASQVTQGRLLRRVNPVFPQFAKTAGIRGSVVIVATIGKDGHLKSMKLIRGDGALAIEAFRAARQWVYAPYRLNGQPIEVDARIVMDFGRQ